MSTRGRGGHGWENPAYSTSSNRGKGRGRGGFSHRGRGGWSGFTNQHVQPGPDPFTFPLGDLLVTLSNKDLVAKGGDLTGRATVTECKSVASYNWMNAAAPTIMVPGKPPLWTPLEKPQKLKEDSGNFFRDPNAARFPSYPTEPAVQAILRVDPEFPTSSIDIFACGSTMGRLLRFVRGVDKSFRFDVEAIGNTVFFIRKEKSPKELIRDVKGYGHTFPEQYTTWEHAVKNSESHQRLVQYMFGGHKCVVRFECDGYINDTTASGSVGGMAGNTMLSDEDGLIHALQSTTVSQALASLEDSLTITSGGSEVPQVSIFDLKTRSGKYGRSIDMENFLPVLYLKQIPNFIVAYHDGYGTFPTQNIQVHKLDKDLQKWEETNKDALKRLAIVLNKITKMARDDEKGLLEVHCPSADRLEIRRQFENGSHALPRSLREEWVHGGQDSSELTNSDDMPETFYDTQEGISLQGGYDKHFDSGFDSDSDDGGKDFTACSADDCGYCGRCSY